MVNYRCHKCSSLLYKAKGEIDAEVICYKCRTINYPFRDDQCIGLRGQDFQQTCITHRCDNCNHMLLKTNGNGIVEIKCKWCKHLSEHNTKLIREGKFEFKRTENFNSMKKSLAL